MNWTAEQRAAIETTGRSLLVSAGAGAGKTAVLVQRVIRHLTVAERPADIDRLLVVTFTEAAAREVRARVREALHLAAATRPELRRQLALVDRAWISTLHSFCLRLLRKYFYLLDLDPGFRVAAEEEALLLRLEAADELFEDCYEQAGTDFLDLVDAYSHPGGDLRLKRAVLDLHAFAGSQPDPRGWLRAAGEAFQVPAGTRIEDLPWWPALEEGVRLGLGRVAGLVEAALRLARRPGGPTAWLPVLETEAAAAAGILGSLGDGWGAAYAAVQELTFARLPGHRGAVDEAVREQARSVRDEAKAALNALREAYFTRSPGEQVDELRALAPRMACLTGLVAAFDDVYTAAKAARSLLDFADLERYCLRLLQGSSPVATELRLAFHEVLVDEYQDINPLQDAILGLVSRGDDDPSPNLFLVGDVKQSIYRFRLAEPGLFLSRYHAYPERPRCRRIPLAVNFRSRPAIIHAVNYLFRQLLTPGVGELAYDQDAELVAHLPDGGGGVEVHLLEREGADEGDPRGDFLETMEREARLVAHRIRAMVDGPELVGDPPRPLRYRDFAVLLRATRGHANQVVETLRLAGVPACGELATGYFQAIEVQVVLSVLRLIDNPRQDIPLACVLRSPLVGLDPADMARLRLGDPQSFADAALVSTDPRLERFRERLDAWRTLARRGPLADLIGTIYRETRYPEYVGAMPAGAQRQANLMALQDRARAFDRYATRGLVSFLRLLEGLEEADEDLGAAMALSEGEDAVRVMSVHRSKGLEFPVVFLAGLGRRLRLGGDNPDLLFHRRLGLGPAVVDRAADVVYPSLAQRAVAGRLRLESLAEELRILYVAMTRARERLCLVGSARGLDRAVTRWQVAVAGHRDWRLPDALLAEVETPLEWLGMALARHPGLDWGLPAADRLPAGEPSRFRVIRWERLPDPPGRREAARPESVPPVPELEERFQRALEWRYPWTRLAGRAAKATVTELKGRDWVAGGERPSAGAGSGVEAGIATHLVLRHLRLETALDPADVAAQVESMVERELLSPTQAGLVDRVAIGRFFSSPLGRRLKVEPARVRREVAFTLALPAAEVYPEVPPDEAGEEQVLVQGVIDCLFDEVGGLVVVDFKTDRATPASIATLVERYSPQLRLYARAAATILGRPVQGAYLHFLAAGITAGVTLEGDLSGPVGGRSPAPG
ncbi:MAG: helicase-exonuclease AddAB subunit AddA [bacterium]|nr:helicase-exonuclease AddAB subunit AddA [bacterium]